MSFLGKLSLHGAPAAPCRRTDDRENFGWPQDEFDDDDDDDGNGDMYEPPPCGPAVKVRERPVEENVYLDKQSSPTVLQRQAIPPHRSYKPVTKTKTQQCGPLFFDTNTRKPPEIDRKEKPGRKAAMFPPAAASLPPSIEEDVYIDPNGEQENSDGLYLETLEACPLTSPRTMRMSYPSKAVVTSPPISIMKPPLPRPKPNSFLPSLAESKRDPSVHIKLPTPIPRTSRLANLKEASQSSSNPPMTNPALVASLKEYFDNQNKEWFAGDLNRKSAEILLLKINKDGAFLIRPSSDKSVRQPFTLAVLYQQKVYNVPIRFLKDTQGYALGKEGKTSEEVFSSLEEMILFHQKNQLLLIDSKTQAKQTAYLSHPVRP
ncbi:B-cell linker protein isoform X2 [Gouania willdenowi]|uniref:B-cell linker protein isoform X2 n=1 Tax=Gouania willdenowi TaxID=441366 RepID=UPI001054C856|nr:B-cell linker protein-like isoform X2 [Gouania willdenowi]